jgi:hypothetical protein
MQIYVIAKNRENSLFAVKYDNSCDGESYTKTVSELIKLKKDGHNLYSYVNKSIPVEIHLVEVKGNVYLRTNQDKTPENNLGNLPPMASQIFADGLNSSRVNVK